ncbi:DUF445 domain-containing protein [Actinospongicola halichondriae]|uniref:DUF445 domain-containing protein n=1 Tax=Actinospongicola halichondriae TaxID=3236844 RepID=UPI003D540A17
MFAAANIIAVLIIVPLVTAFIGYVTNWAAVKMIFLPEEFVGVKPGGLKIGWQGVLPSKADTFATDVAGTVGDVISPAELVERIDPAELESLLSDRLDAELPTVLRDAAEMLSPGVWDQMAPEAQQMVATQIKTEGRQVTQEIFDDLQGISDDILDLESLVFDLLSGPNVKRLTRLFQEIGGKELKAIVRFGGYFGFVIGVFQAISFSVFDQWWLMPLVGGIVGLGTNYLALQMIFRPIEPKKYAGLVTYQGMFPSRQAEIAADYGRISEREILTPANLLRIITEGEAGTKIARLVLTKVSERVDQAKPMVEMLAQTEITDEQLEAVKWMVVQRVGQAVPELQPEVEAYLEKRLGVAELVETKLSAMPKLEFERLLRGIFEQDEWILIVIGGALGAGVGLLQGLAILSLG